MKRQCFIDQKMETLKKSFQMNSIESHSPDTSIMMIPAPKQPAQRQSRFKLWELQDCWHCMIVGSCLTLAEVRQAASKAKMSVANKTDYSIHQLAVESAANKQHPLAKRLQSLLEKKYVQTIKKYRVAKTSDELSELWSVSWDSGEVGSGLWALLTHPNANRDIMMEAFGQVHMLSHLFGASVCVERRQHLQQECSNSKLNHELEAMKSRFDKVNSMLQEQTTLLESEKAKVRTLSAAVNQAKKESQKIPSTSVNKPSNSNHVVNMLRKKNHSLEQNIVDAKTLTGHQANEIARLKRLLSVYNNSAQKPQDRELKLCGQCILYLGGKAQQRRHFKALVESCEGRFLYHDGGRESCPHRISDLVSQADVVMCPTDCISHRAMEKARTLCAKQEKPIVFMQRASLSSFTRSLQEVLQEE